MLRVRVSGQRVEWLKPRLGVPSLGQEGGEREGDEDSGGGGKAHEDNRRLHSKGDVDQWTQGRALHERKASQARGALGLQGQFRVGKAIREGIRGNTATAGCAYEGIACSIPGL